MPKNERSGAASGQAHIRFRLLGDYENDAVSAEEIDKIRNGLASGCLLRPHPNVSVGTPVRVRSGVFEGVEGIVTEFRHQCHVIIALSAVQQSFSLELRLEDIQVLHKMPPRSVSTLPEVNQNLNFVFPENSTRREQWSPPALRHQTGIAADVRRAHRGQVA